MPDGTYMLTDNLEKLRDYLQEVLFTGNGHAALIDGGELNIEKMEMPDAFWQKIAWGDEA